MFADAGSAAAAADDDNDDDNADSVGRRFPLFLVSSLVTAGGGGGSGGRGGSAAAGSRSGRPYEWLLQIVRPNEFAAFRASRIQRWRRRLEERPNGDGGKKGKR